MNNIREREETHGAPMEAPAEGAGAAEDVDG